MDLIVRVIYEGYTIESWLVDLADGTASYTPDGYAHVDEGQSEYGDIQWGVFEVDGKLYKVDYTQSSYGTSKLFKRIKEVKAKVVTGTIYE